MKPPRMSTRLTVFQEDIKNPERQLVLDLWRNFSKRIILQISIDGWEDVNFYFPAFVDSNLSSYCYGNDLGRAFQLCLLEFADENGQSVPVETADLALEFLSPVIQHLESEEVFSNGKTTYPLTRINAKLLLQFRRFLIPGKSYQLR